jgi:hypothetical protein
MKTSFTARGGVRRALLPRGAPKMLRELPTARCIVACCILAVLVRINCVNDADLDGYL